MKFLTGDLIEVEERKISNTESEFKISPLFTGMGHSIGNALRRSLLSVVKGIAITKMKISINDTPIKHLFTTFPPIIEDFLEISTRIKEIELKGELIKDEEIEKGDRLMLNNLVLKGPVYASNLIMPPQIELMNPDLLLFTLSKDAMINMELYVEENVGYRKASILSQDENQILNDQYHISLDSIFSKVLNVKDHVKEIVAGKYSGMDELVINVQTKASITPATAFKEVIDILAQNLQSIGKFGELNDIEEKIEEEQDISKESSDDTANAYSDQPIGILNLSTRASNCLHANNIHSIKQLKDCSFEDLMKINNLGSKSINEIVEKLKQFNFILK